MTASGPADLRARSWIERHQGLLFPYHDASSPGTRLLRTDELVDGHLARVLDQLSGRGIPRAAAGMYVGGWYGGLAASFVTVTLATADAGLVLHPEAVRWSCHPGGYPDAIVVDQAPGLAVLDGHPWAGDPLARVEPSPTERAAAVVDGLVATLAPVLQAVQRTSRAGLVGLWHLVADSIAGAVDYQPAIGSTPQTVGLVTELLAAPGAPWKRRPVVELRDTAVGPACVTRRAGCCLAYTDPTDAEPDDPDQRAFREVFPLDDRPGYCVTCKFRPAEESVRMQLWWHERRAR